MNPDLTNLVQNKQNQPALGSGIDWDDRRDKYLAAVDSLYHEIETILAEPIAQKRVTLQRRPKQLTESYIGTYSVNDLILLIGNEQVRFSPFGRNVAGATGRVDVVGERAEATLLAQLGPRWGFVRNRQPTLHTVPFSESVLAEVLKRVMRD